jgi:ribonuclease VapC
MIAVDTSALVAIVLREATAADCIESLAAEASPLISAGTMVEALVVAARRNVVAEMTRLLGEVAFKVIPVTEAAARRIGVAYARWGKGVHPARLNFGDCFAYDVAQDNACPLLFVGGDFAKTDIRSVLPSRG